MSDSTQRNRLRWQCRRGLLELDVVFARFLDQSYDGLDAEQQAVFAELLECSDVELQAWILFGQPLSEGRFEPLIRRLQSAD